MRNLLDVEVPVAVAVEDGLLVPVIPFTDQKSLTQIGAEVKDKAINKLRGTSRSRLLKNYLGS